MRKRGLSNTVLLPADEDGDAGQLYDDIFRAAAAEPGSENVVDPGSVDPATPPQSTHTSTDTPRPTPRPILSIARTTTASAAYPSSVRRYKAGERRNLNEIFEFLDGKEVTHIEIRDPYAFVDDTQPLLTRMLSELSGRCKNVQATEIACWSPDNKRVRDQTMRFNAPDARLKWTDMVQQNFGPKCQAIAEFRNGPANDFHDRWITFNIREAGNTVRMRVDLSKGVSSLMSNRSECTISIAPLN